MTKIVMARYIAGTLLDLPGPAAADNWKVQRLMKTRTKVDLEDLYCLAFEARLARKAAED